MSNDTTKSRFECFCNDLSFFTESGSQIRVMEDNTGRLKIAIVVDSSTSKLDLNRSWELANKWCKRLDEFQGPWVDGGKGEYLFTLWRLHQGRGWSYRKIAAWLNNQIEQKLRRFIVEHDEWLDSLEHKSR